MICELGEALHYQLCIWPFIETLCPLSVNEWENSTKPIVVLGVACYRWGWIAYTGAWSGAVRLWTLNPTTELSSFVSTSSSRPATPSPLLRHRNKKVCMHRHHSVLIALWVAHCRINFCLPHLAFFILQHGPTTYTAANKLCRSSCFSRSSLCPRSTDCRVS